jgi:hypothetical protein
VEKYGTARQATDDNITQRMRFARRTNKAADTHSTWVADAASFRDGSATNRPRLSASIENCQLSAFFPHIFSYF